MCILLAERLFCWATISSFSRSHFGQIATVKWKNNEEKNDQQPTKSINNNFWIKPTHNGTNLNYQFRFPQNFNYYIGTITKSIVNKQFMLFLYSFVRWMVGRLVGSFIHFASQCAHCQQQLFTFAIALIIFFLSICTCTDLCIWRRKSRWSLSNFFWLIVVWFSNRYSNLVSHKIWQISLGCFGRFVCV